MDKIFEQNIIEQDNILCKIPTEILKIISKCLQADDVVHLSHTCKELHQKLPFYLKQSGIVTILASVKAYYPWFEGPAINCSISEINISFTVVNKYILGKSEIVIWMQIIRSGIVVLESQKYSIRTRENFQIKIKNAILKEYKYGDRLRFMAHNDGDMFSGFKSIDFSFQLSLQLKNYQYGKPIKITKKVKGYADFKSPSVFIDMKDASKFRFYSFLRSNLHCLLGVPYEGNTSF